MVDGCQSKQVNVVSGVPQGRVLGQLLFLLFTLELSSKVENLLSVNYAGEYTFIAVAASLGVKVAPETSAIYLCKSLTLTSAIN